MTLEEFTFLRSTTVVVAFFYLMTALFSFVWFIAEGKDEEIFSNNWMLQRLTLLLSLSFGFFLIWTLDIKYSEYSELELWRIKIPVYNLIVVGSGLLMGLGYFFRKVPFKADKAIAIVFITLAILALAIFFIKTGINYLHYTT